MGAIDIAHVTKANGATQVIHGISLRVEDGAFVVLVDPSGCGKSTFVTPPKTWDELLKRGKLNLSGEAAKKPFALWADLKAANVTPPNLAEIAIDRIRQNFQAGNLLFGMTWGYVWNRAQGDADSTVKGKVGVVPFLTPLEKAEWRLGLVITPRPPLDEDANYQLLGSKPMKNKDLDGNTAFAIAVMTD